MLITPGQAIAASIPVGFVSWDITQPGIAGQFDIANETGPNSSGDETAPIIDPVRLTNIALDIRFSDESAKLFGAEDFTLNPFDQLSFESPSIPIGGVIPEPVQAILTGAFQSTLVTLFDGSHITILPDFETTVSNGGSALVDGDLAIIWARSPGGADVPEPSLILPIAAFFLFVLAARRGPGYRNQDGLFIRRRV